MSRGRACLPISLLLWCACSQRGFLESQFEAGVRARAHFENGDFGAARSGFEALARDTEDADMWANLGLAARQDGDRDAAEEAWSTALRLQPANPRALVFLAQSLSERAQEDLARAASGSDEPEVGARARDRLENAADLLERAAAASPSDASIQQILGTVRRELGATDAAERASAAAHNLDPVLFGTHRPDDIVLPAPRHPSAGHLPMHFEPERTSLRAVSVLALPAGAESGAALALLGTGWLVRADTLGGSVRWREHDFAAGKRALLASAVDLDADTHDEMILVSDAESGGAEPGSKESRRSSDVWLAGADREPQRLVRLPVVRRILVRDLDRDGDLDLLFVSADAPGLHLYDNQGGLRFVARAVPGLENLPGLLDVACADLTGDARPDFVCADVMGRLRVLGQRADGTFADIGKVSGLVRERGRVLETLDVDADGFQDLLVGNDTGLWVFANRGGGRFARQGAYRVPQTAWGGRRSEDIEVLDLCLLDHDGDGLEDVLTLHPLRDKPIVVASEPAPAEDAAPPAWDPQQTSTRAAVRIWRNEGRGVFLEVSEKLNLGREPFLVSMPAVEDFDGDGDVDFATVLTDSAVQIYWNRGGNVHRRLLLHGTPGARVDFYAGERRLQKELRAHTAWIGAGTIGRFDIVRVAWSDGSVQNDFDVDVAETRVLQLRRRR